METLVPRIQEHLRANGFPFFEELTEHTLSLGPAASPKLETQTRWLFQDKDRTNAITLTTSALTLQVTNYSQFEEFLDLLRPILELTEQLVAPGYYSRLGLRYVNSIENIGEEVRQYFRDNVLSFRPEDLAVESILATHQVTGRIAAKQINIRMLQVENTPLLPADLIGPAFPELAEPRPGLHAILDIDGTDSSAGDFSPPEIEANLWAIHEYTERAFWEATTPEAHENWGLKCEEME